MLLIKIPLPRATTSSPAALHRLQSTLRHQALRSSSPLPSSRLLLLHHYHARIQQRCFASQPPSNHSSTTSQTASSVQSQLQRQAKAASKAKHEPKYEIPERLLIYHAGTGRTTFLAMLKVTSLFLGAFFCFVAVPNSIKDDRPAQEVAGTALCGIVPVLFIAFTTSPFVTHIHIHLPPSARPSRTTLDRFIRTALPPSTPLTLTTMSPIGKPRYSSLTAGDLHPVLRSRGRRLLRLGLVNWVRGGDAAAAENSRRKWYMFRAVTRFYVQEKAAARRSAGAGGAGAGAAATTTSTAKERGKGASTVRRRYQKPNKNKGLVEGWIWDVLKEKLQAREGVAKTG